MAESMSNFEYLEEVLRFKACSNPVKFQEVLEVMERYSKKGDRWWIRHSSDPVRLTARQLNERILLIPISTLMQGLTMVLGRRPGERELKPLNQELISEFSKKYTEYQKKNHI